MKNLPQKNLNTKVLANLIDSYKSGFIDFKVIRRYLTCCNQGGMTTLLLDKLHAKAVQYWRNPTPFEIKRGYGAIHYRDFRRSECSKPGGELKKWFIANDGLRCNY